MLDYIEHRVVFGFYSESKEESLQCLRKESDVLWFTWKESDVLWFTFLRKHSCCCVEHWL